MQLVTVTLQPGNVLSVFIILADQGVKLVYQGSMVMPWVYPKVIVSHVSVVQLVVWRVIQGQSVINFPACVNVNYTLREGTAMSAKRVTTIFNQEKGAHHVIVTPLVV